MGAIGKTARGVKSTVRAGKNTVRATVTWPFALLFGPFYDLRLRRKANEADLSPLHASTRRNLEGATGARWASAIIYIAILILLAVFGGWVAVWAASFFTTAAAQPSEWLFAPLIPVAWAVYVRRAAWWRGQPTLRRMLSPGAWVVTGLSLMPPTVFLFEALFEPLDGELRGWLVHGSGWLAVAIGFISALSVAERLKRPTGAVADLTDAELVMEALDMPPTQFQKALADGSMAVGREGTSIRAKLPPGTGKLLEDRDAIAARLAKRKFEWEVGLPDPVERVFVLLPLSKEERARREALDISKGLFNTASTAGADAPAIELNIDWDNQSPRS